MRTANEILQKEMNKGVDMHEGIVSAMKQYAKEALEEAALKLNGTYFNANGANVTEHVKQAVLGLIK